MGRQDPHRACGRRRCLGSLSDLLISRRAEILDRWTRRIARAHAPDGLDRGELWDHLPHILDELVAALSAGEGPSDLPDGSPASAQHGRQRLRAGFDVQEVVREYGILADLLLDEVARAGEPVSVDEWRLALRALDTGIAEAVAAYVRRRDEELHRQTGRHVAFLAHELRNPLMNARSALAALRVAPSDDRLQAILERSLRRLGALIDQVVTSDRLASEVEIRHEPLDLATLLHEVAVEDARAAAESRDVKVTLQVGSALVLAGDHRLLQSALGNLVGNAVKFTRPGGTVAVRATRREGSVVLEVEDGCGGLPPGDPDDLFEPFVQRGDNRSGLGLGLAIVRQAVSAHGGRVSVQNRPGLGCVFVVTLPADPRIPA